MDSKNDKLSWLDEFETLANAELAELSEGSACQQIHPIIETWHQEWLNSEIEEPRDSVTQAVACLATEMLGTAPDTILNALIEYGNEEEVYQWIQSILITGQAFQSALDSGRLDDL